MGRLGRPPGPPTVVAGALVEPRPGLTGLVEVEVGVPLGGGDRARRRTGGRRRRRAERSVAVSAGPRARPAGGSGCRGLPGVLSGRAGVDVGLGHRRHAAGRSAIGYVAVAAVAARAGLGGRPGRGTPRAGRRARWGPEAPRRVGGTSASRRARSGRRGRRPSGRRGGRPRRGGGRTSCALRVRARARAAGRCTSRAGRCRVAGGASGRGRRRVRRRLSAGRVRACVAGVRCGPGCDRASRRAVPRTRGAVGTLGGRALPAGRPAVTGRGRPPAAAATSVARRVVGGRTGLATRAASGSARVGAVALGGRGRSRRSPPLAADPLALALDPGARLLRFGGAVAGGGCEGLSFGPPRRAGCQRRGSGASSQQGTPSSVEQHYPPRRSACPSVPDSARSRTVRGPIGGRDRWPPPVL